MHARCKPEWTNLAYDGGLKAVIITEVDIWQDTFNPHHLRDEPHKQMYSKQTANKLLLNTTSCVPLMVLLH
jgi:hypothetical protein